MVDEYRHLLFEWETRSQKRHITPTILRRSEVDERFLTDFPHVNTRILERIHKDNIENCYNYVSDVLIAQYKFTLLRIEHFLLCQNNPLEICFETVQAVLNRLKSMYDISRYEYSSDSLRYRHYESPNRQFEPIRSSSAPTSTDQDYFSFNHSLHEVAPIEQVAAPPEDFGMPFNMQPPFATPSQNTPITPPPGSSTFTLASMRGRTLGKSAIQGPPTASSSASIQGPPQDAPISPNLPSSQKSPQLSSSRSLTKKQKRCRNETDHHFCRSWNLKFLKPCGYIHLYRSPFQQEGDAKKATDLVTLDPNSSLYVATQADFLSSWKAPKKPTVTMIQQIKSAKLDRFFKMTEDSMKMPNTRPLYHGTCEANFARIFDDGLQLPSDFEVNPNCPSCGSLYKKIGTSTCNADCEHCAGENAVQHKWNKCHMFGLGIYFADQSSKSDRYVSDSTGNTSQTKGKKILVVSVALGNPYTVSALKSESELHDLTTPPNNKDSIMALGTGTQTQSNLNVINNEYVIFNPRQTLPTFVITYDK